MNHFLLFFILISSLSFSQSTDYNTKKGFAANGYDVVAYFKNTPIEGIKKFVTEYDGVYYKFSTKEHLNTFIKNPKKYLPQYGGYCAYAIAVNSEKVSINPESFEIKDGKLYLFYNAWGINTLTSWKKENSNTLKQKADKNWEKIKVKK